MFHNLAGHWEGEWDNQTFQTNGAVLVDATINPDCTAQVIIQKDQLDPWTVNATYQDDAGGVIIQVSNDPIFGNTSVTVTGLDFTATGSMSFYGIKEFTATGSINPNLLAISMNIDMTFQDDSTATETVTLHRDATPTPVPTEEPTATSGTPSTVPTQTETPTATPPGNTVVWGNSDCDTQISTRDNQALLRKILSQALLSTEDGCPVLGDSVLVRIVSPAGGSGVPLLWGDWDCNGELSTRDNQALLRKVLQQPPLSQEQGCPELGQQVTASG